MKKIIIQILAVLMIIPLVFSAGSGGGGSTNPKDNCTKDIWDCSTWSDCTSQNLKVRQCTLSKDCPNDIAPKPTESESCEYISDTISQLKCFNQNFLKERVKCRLELSDEEVDKELKIAYLPEECRSLENDAEKEECVQIYSRSQKCWHLDTQKERMQCIKDTFEIKDLKKEKQECQNPSCFAGVKKKAFMLIKFNFYELEERAERLLEDGKITEDQASNVISDLEEKKIEFNNAKTKDERKKLILDVKKIWTDFVNEVKGAK